MNTSVKTDQPAVNTSKKGFVIGLVLALVGAGGGFFATYSGLASSLLGSAPNADETTRESLDTSAEPIGRSEAPLGGQRSRTTGFVPLDPITISLGPRGQSRHLRFSAQLEVASGHSSEVEHLKPRITDVLNIYLRALDPTELEEPAALLRLRAQMLRRIQIVTGPGFVNDLLIMEFVLN